MPFGTLHIAKTLANMKYNLTIDMKNRILTFAIGGMLLLFGCKTSQISQYDNEGNETVFKVRRVKKDQKMIVEKVKSSTTQNKNSILSRKIAETQSTPPNSNGIFNKVSIYEDLEDIKFPRIRVNELIQIKGEKDILLKRTYAISDEYIIKFKSNFNISDKKNISNLFNNLNGISITSLEQIPNTQIILTKLNIDKSVVKFDLLQIEEYLINALTIINEIEYAEPNNIGFINLASNDGYIGSLWGFDNTGQTGGTANADISLFEAWDIETGDSSVVVGVLDTGVDWDHPDLVNNIWRNLNEIGLDANGVAKDTNGIDDDNNGYIDDYLGWDFYNNDNNPDDDHSHGTHVAGTIGAEGNNNLGIAGVCWDVQIVPLKWIGGSGYGGVFDAIKAVHYSISVGVNMTNNSWHVPADIQNALYDAINLAGDKDMLFIAAAGNSSENTDIQINIPSSFDCDNLISVMATDHNDQIASFSSYGNVTVDIAAPGTQIFSTAPFDGYGWKSGTSMASPMITGLCALIKSKSPNLNASQIKARVMQMSDRLSSLSGKSASGGRANAYESLQSFSSVNVPVGTIVPFYGDKALIPDNWVICDGNTILDPLSPYHNTASPNLAGRFLMGESNQYPAKALGGIDNVASHSHAFRDNRNKVWFPVKSGSGHTSSYHLVTAANGLRYDANRVAIAKPKASPHPYDTHGHINGHSNVSGMTNPGGSHDNKPLFYSTIYILKIK